MGFVTFQQFDSPKEIALDADLVESVRQREASPTGDSEKVCEAALVRMISGAEYVLADTGRHVLRRICEAQDGATGESV